MYAVHDTFFTADPQDKQRKLGELRDEVLELLKEAEKGAGPSPDGRPASLSGDDKGRMWYLRGKALDVCEAHSEEAEAALVKAVKLLPHCIDAYNALGNCFWKRRTPEGMRKAKDCFTNALSQQNNKESLRQLSMVLRQLGKGSEEYVLSL